MRTLQQVEQDEIVYTESCMDGSKDTSIWNKLVTNREDFRGKCASEARGHFRAERTAAEQEEATIRTAENKGYLQTLGTGGTGINTNLIIIAAIAIVAIYFLLS